MYALMLERKIVEDKLSKSEIFYKSLLNSLSHQIAVVDRKGVIVAVSNSWNEFAFDNGNDTLKNISIGTNYFHVCQKAFDSGDESAYNALYGIKSVLDENRNNFYMEYPCHSTNEKRWYSMLATKFKGDESLVVIEHQNITALKLAEQEREKITVDLIQRKEHMEQFSYIISHNLRGPLASILGFTNLLEGTKLEFIENFDVIQGMATSANKLDEVIKDLNEILQVKTQLFEKKEDVYFNDLVKEISLTIDQQIQDQGITIKTNFDNVDKIHSNKNNMYSIFYHLIHNSIKYRKPDVTGIIEIKSQQTSDGFQLRFKDNGLGIDLKKNSETIFGLYKRFHRNIEGKGMGLFMVKKQVETLGGNISVTSEVNYGTEFILEFKKDTV
jgi:signal transduction histidine kinase